MSGFFGLFYFNAQLCGNTMGELLPQVAARGPAFSRGHETRRRERWGCRIIVDDFLARGEALQGFVSIVLQAGAQLGGAGIVIEKRFQRGGDALRAEGIRIESLAAIASMEPGVIHFV